ncbi:MAG: D-glycero-beta-D-manno-heptose 1-phosphate adenylyltransferase [Bacteroidota bacterium]
MTTIQDRCQSWRVANQRIVFTNGCFDLLHYGHLHYLYQARDLGDVLVVGLNANASVSRLKGAHRPIKDEKTRMYLMAALSCVDALVVFPEDTPLKLIECVQPDVLVQGGDWNISQIVGADFVLAQGGKVKTLAFVEGYSTSLLEQKIKDQS